MLVTRLNEREQEILEKAREFSGKSSNSQAVIYCLVKTPELQRQLTDLKHEHDLLRVNMDRLKDRLVNYYEAKEGLDRFITKKLNDL